MPEPTTAQIEAFIQRWQKSGAAERANYVLFLSELCDLLDIPRPEPAGPDNAANRYCFERAVVRRNPDGTTSTGYIDLYKHTCLLFFRDAVEATPLWLVAPNALNLHPFPLADRLARPGPEAEALEQALLSIFAHGLTAMPGIRWYAGKINSEP